MDADEEAAMSKPDKAEDIKPRFHKSKTHDIETNFTTPATKNNVLRDDDDEEEDYEEVEEDEDDVYSEWNLRKCAASALDRIASVYGDEILTIILPSIKTELFHPDWQHRECGVLVLGAIAEGCMEGTQL